MKRLFMTILLVALSAAAWSAAGYVQTLETKIHILVNRERVNEGLPPLAYSAKLSAIARSHSADMAARGFTDHVNPDGLNPSDRAKKAGYNIIKRKKNSIRTGVGENIYEHQAYMTGDGRETPYLDDVNTVAKKAVMGWMNSPGHRKNILNPDYTSAGVGAAVSKDKKVKITQMFF
jgi:uncharacterized protein YkwD